MPVRDPYMTRCLECGQEFERPWGIDDPNDPRLHFCDQHQHQRSTGREEAREVQRAIAARFARR